MSVTRGPRWARRVGAAVGAALVLAAPLAAAAGPATEQVRADVGRLFAALAEPVPVATAARSEAVHAAARDAFDWQEMAARTLGSHWAARTDAERQEFTALLSELVEGQVNVLAEYAGSQIEFVSESVDGDRATVRSRVTTAARRALSLDYRLVHRDGRWRVWDVLVDGASLVGGYREQVSRIIRRDSYAALVQQLRAR